MSGESKVYPIYDPRYIAPIVFKNPETTTPKGVNGEFSYPVQHMSRLRQSSFTFGVSVGMVVGALLLSGAATGGAVPAIVFTVMAITALVMAYSAHQAHKAGVSGTDIFKSAAFFTLVGFGVGCFGGSIGPGGIHTNMVSDAVLKTIPSMCGLLNAFFVVWLDSKAALIKKEGEKLTVSEYSTTNTGVNRAWAAKVASWFTGAEFKFTYDLNAQSSVTKLLFFNAAAGNLGGASVYIPKLLEAMDSTQIVYLSYLLGSAALTLATGYLAKREDPNRGVLQLFVNGLFVASASAGVMGVFREFSVVDNSIAKNTLAGLVMYKADQLSLRFNERETQEEIENRWIQLQVDFEAFFDRLFEQKEYQPGDI